ncbi:MAG: hypothetical protein WCZ98_01395 [Sideroxydans sp.]|jgi:hypothetical protein
MSISGIVKNNPMLVAGVVVAGVALAWLALRGAKGMGKDIGGGAVDLAVGIVSGAGNAVTTNALDPAVNPFYDAGSSLGGLIFDITHPKGY